MPPLPRRDVLRRDTLRVAWLMVGAAIGLAAALLLVGLAQVVAPPGARTAFTAVLLLTVALLGLLPGVRDLEVTAARTLLGVTGELVTPERPTATHRRRTVATVLLHLVLGLLAGLLLVGVVPAGLAASRLWSRGSPLELAGREVEAPGGPTGLVLGLLAVVVALVLVVLLGRLAAAVVGRLLGPTAEDRLAVALARLEAEAAHTRLARELHDGIGHALTVISLQATAARRVLAVDPERAQTSLGTIEDTARAALGELDDMLGSLRRGAVQREATPGLDRLDALLASFRDAGMTVRSEVDPLPWLPALTSATAYQVVAEALTNAARHAGPGPVELRVRSRSDALHVVVSSPLRPAPPAAGSGRGLGLTGLGERVRLLGGTTTAGPEGGRWMLSAELPRSSRG